MLTIDFKVNGHAVMRVHVHNRGRARSGRTGAELHRYAWAIERLPGLEYEPARLHGQLVHDRAEGAIGLASKVLEQAGVQAGVHGPAALRHPAPPASDGS